MRSIEKFLQPISAAQPAGRSMFYEDIYTTIQEAARADDTLPKGVWEVEEKVSDWRRVAGLCEQILTESSKDFYIASFLARAWCHLDGMDGCIAGVQLMEQLSDKFWGTGFPVIDSAQTHRLSCFVSFYKHMQKAIRLMPLFLSKEDLTPRLSVYDFVVVQRLMQSEQNTSEAHKAIRQNWEESARIVSAEYVEEIFTKTQSLECRHDD